MQQTEISSSLHKEIKANYNEALVIIQELKNSKLEKEKSNLKQNIKEQN